jgi:hypothetical protein
MTGINLILFIFYILAPQAAPLNIFLMLTDNLSHQKIRNLKSEI